jgi:hypothetical protein
MSRFYFISLSKNVFRIMTKNILTINKSFNTKAKLTNH